MAGHLFIAQGDLASLACDAILIPSGYALRGGVLTPGNVRTDWAQLLGTTDGFIDAPSNPPPLVWRHRQGLFPEPALWVGHTGDDSHSTTERVRVLLAYVEQAGAEARRSIQAAAAPKRPLSDLRPLLGVPLVGTGLGGQAHEAGDVVRAVVAPLVEAAARLDVDVALVLRHGPQLSAAQQARVRLGQRSAPASLAVRSDLTEELATLVSQARAGRLVLFLGAGASMGAGLPSWSELLDELLARAGLSAAVTESMRSTLDNRDLGTLIEARLGGQFRSVLRDLIRNGIPRRPDGGYRVSLVHQLLASLPTTQAITTNYDTLYEQAAHDAGRTLDVVPGASEVGSDWLLKLHGSIDGDDERIVLARGDYLRMEEEGAALAGLVQGMLLTRHLLFVGYSLTDDNFHRMVHQVRATASWGRQEQRVGTVLTPNPLSVVREIWRPQIEFVSTAVGEEPSPRDQAIFLDQLLAETTSPAQHLLDGNYAAVFNDEEQALGEALRQAQVLSRGARIRPAMRDELTELFKRLGG